MTFSEESVGTLGYAEMQLLPEPLYSLGTDAIHMLCVKVRRLVRFRCPNVFSKVFNSLMYVHILFNIQGTSLGRAFLGGKDGCLYEFAYKADEGWFGKKAQKINHSNSTFSFLIPVGSI